MFGAQKYIQRAAVAATFPKLASSWTWVGVNKQLYLGSVTSKPPLGGSPHFEVEIGDNRLGLAF